MAGYWERGSMGAGLEVHRLATEPQASASMKGRVCWVLGSFFLLLLRCFLVLLLKPSCFYKSCLLGARSFSFAGKGAVAYTVSNRCNYWVGLALMAHTHWHFDITSPTVVHT